ncbi:MAG: hypothetical protein ACYC6C_13555 [Coriobacteriia bacterium]
MTDKSIDISDLINVWEERFGEGSRTQVYSFLIDVERAAAERAWDEGWSAAQQVVEELDGEKVWLHTVLIEGYEPNPYRA